MSTARRRLTLLAAFLAAYLLSYFFRSTNAVLADDLRRDASLSPEQLGAMTSLFFVGFAVAQLPLGAALDRWGPRLVTPALMLAAAVGSVVTAAADGFVGLAVGRTLIGFGMAGVLMGALKAFAAWFAPARFPTVSAVFVGLGSLGALGATTPLAALAASVGWRQVFVLAAVATAVTAAWLVVVVRAAPPRAEVASRPPPTEPPVAPAAAAREAGAAPRGEPAVGFGTIFTSGPFWRLAFLILALTGGMFAHQGLWGGPFLSDGLGLPTATTARLLFVLGAAVTASYLLAGPAAGRWGVDRVIAGGAALAVLALLGLSALTPSTPIVVMAAVWALYGAGAGANVLGFAAARSLFPTAAGRAVTAVNLFAIGGSALLQAGLGWVVVGVSMASGGDPDAPSLAAYRAAIGVTAALLATAWMVFMLGGWSRSAGLGRPDSGSGARRAGGTGS